MHFRKLLLVIAAVTAVTFSVGLRGQGLIDGIKVTLPEPVTVGDKVLEPGEYEIRRPSSANRDILQIFNKDKMVYETNVLTVPTGPDNKDPKETKVVLHHIGDAYYFDKIWMEDKNYGWEFPLPERARALQREAALSVPAARYESSAGSQATTSGQVAAAPRYEGPGLAAELDAIAAQEDRQAALDANRDKDRDRAEQDRQAQLDRNSQTQDRDQVAALQPQTAPVASPQSDARVSEPQSSTTQRSEPQAQSSTQRSESQSNNQRSALQSSNQRNSDTPDQLPETATNWVALVLGGGLLLALSFAVRPLKA